MFEHNEKFTGLAHILGQLQAFSLGNFSQTAGPTCEFSANPVNFSFTADMRLAAMQ
jgi:hypothetical protein